MKVLLLNSGGKDSLGAAMLLREHEVHSVYIDAGWPCREAAMVAAAEIASRYCASHDVAAMAIPNTLSPIPNHQTIAYQAQVLHLVGASMAKGLGFDAVGSGQRPDAAERSFPDDLDRMLASSRFFTPVQFVMPLWTLSQSDSEIAIKADPLWTKTVYCNCATPCGVCGKCKQRAAWLARDMPEPHPRTGVIVR